MSAGKTDRGVAVIILNYMTWKLTGETAEMLERVLGIAPSDVIMVDNRSPNDSALQLSEICAKRGYVFLPESENKGYAAGNNAGLRYAAARGYAYGWVMNNDVLMSDPQLLEKMLRVFDSDPRIACVSPRVLKPSGAECNREIARPGVWDLTLGALAYRKKGMRLPDGASEADLYCLNYRPQGCCMLLDLKKMCEAGYMDEATFLYCEEPILAERLAALGYRSACCLQASVVHNHSQTISSAMKKFGVIRAHTRSADYLWCEYRRFNPLSRLWCKAFLALRIWLGV